MKFAMVATGGIGGYLAVKLTQAGEDVATLARGKHLDAIRSGGLTLETADGSTTARPRIATDEPAQIGPVDAVIFAVKAKDVERAAQSCLPLLGPDTVVIPFLNGVETVERLATVLPLENIANGTAGISTTITAPGTIRQVGSFASFTFAERDSSQTPRIRAVRSAFERADLEAPVVEDIDVALWRKFCLFASLSGVTAAARCTVGEIRSDPQLSRLFQEGIAETAALGRALGVALPDDLGSRIWKSVSDLPAGMRASTAIDLEAGRALEVDWISGAVARLSDAAGLDAPIHRTLNAVLQPWKDGG
ncbi:MAG: 2-dehydropantoate 2-reductase [Gammaproteobacteria bacterium]|jgi:2-dehydropantoate 2-reductase|nr:2-dehydropantoate 2-reductase [Gammaproteobacteria bacterium]